MLRNHSVHMNLESLENLRLISFALIRFEESKGEVLNAFFCYFSTATGDFLFHLWILTLLFLSYKTGRINKFLEFALKWILTFSACLEGVPLEIRLGDEHHGNKVTLT